MDVDWADGDLQSRPQTQEEPPGVQLPDLRGRHDQGPPDEEGHDGEGEEAGLATHSVHQVDGAEGTEQRAKGKETTCRTEVSF